MSNTRVKQCPDRGTCHHDCADQCFRVGACDPLTGVYPGDEWPDRVRADHITFEAPPRTGLVYRTLIVDRSIEVGSMIKSVHEFEVRAALPLSVREADQNVAAAMVVIQFPARAIGLGYQFECALEGYLTDGRISRAIKMIKAVKLREPRLWWWIPYSIIAWPFKFVWRVILWGTGK